MTYGIVTSVEARSLGSELVADAAAGSTVLALDIVSDFNEDGGTLIVGGTTLAYTSVDPDLETVTLAAPLGSDAAADDFVQVVDAGLPAVAWYASVATEDDAGDTISALIPTTLVPYFPEGTYDQPVSVEIVLRGGDYEVTKQPNTEPSFDGGTVWNPRAKRNAVAVSVPHDVYTTLGAWNDSEVDGITATGGDHVIVYPGTYVVMARIAWPNNANGRRGISILFNGSPIEYDIRGAEPTGATYVRIFDSLRAVEGDVVAIQAYQSSGAALTINGATVSIFRTSS